MVRSPNLLISLIRIYRRISLTNNVKIRIIIMSQDNRTAIFQISDKKQINLIIQIMIRCKNIIMSHLTIIGSSTTMRAIDKLILYQIIRRIKFHPKAMPMFEIIRTSPICSLIENMKRKFPCVLEIGKKQ